MILDEFFSKFFPKILNWLRISCHLIFVPIGESLRIVRPGCLEDYPISCHKLILTVHVKTINQDVVTILLWINLILCQKSTVYSFIGLVSIVVKIVNISTYPFDLVLDGLADEINPLEYIGDVVYSSFLYFKLDSCYI